MRLKNQIIELLDAPKLIGHEECHISHSIIKTVDFLSFEVEIPITIERCIIENLLIGACWFTEGLLFSGNIVVNRIDYQMGGHNKREMTIKGNVFHDFFNFFDCAFIAHLTVEKNVFCKGSNLLGNQGEGFKNDFNQGFTASDNIGSLALDDI